MEDTVNWTPSAAAVASNEQSMILETLTTEVTVTLMLDELVRNTTSDTNSYSLNTYTTSIHNDV